MDLKEGYGRLIASYAKLFIQKINFPRKVLVLGWILATTCKMRTRVDS